MLAVHALSNWEMELDALDVKLFKLEPGWVHIDYTHRITVHLPPSFCIFSLLAKAQKRLSFLPVYFYKTHRQLYQGKYSKLNHKSTFLNTTGT